MTVITQSMFQLLQVYDSTELKLLPLPLSPLVLSTVVESTNGDSGSINSSAVMIS